MIGLEGVKMKSRKIIAILVIALFAVLSSLLPAGAADKRFISVATTQSGTSWYMIGGGVAQIINKNIPGVEANAEVTGGAGENPTLIQKKKADLGFTANAIAFWALNGIGPYKKAGKHPDLRVLLYGQINYTHLVALKGSSIKSLADIKGKKIGMGQPGSGNQIVAKQMFGANGLSFEKDYQPLYLTFVEQVNAMRDGNLDLAVIIAGLPNPQIMDLQTSHDLRFIDITDEEWAKIQAKYPWYLRLEVPADTYKNQPQPIQSLGGMVILFCHKDLEEDLAYKIVKAVLENNDFLKSVHPAGAEWNLDNKAYAQKPTVPFHPGAIKYLKEKGKM